MDLFSRKIVGWEVHELESMELSADLITRICAEQAVDPDTLLLHSDNGGPMKGSTMLATLHRLGVVPRGGRSTFVHPPSFIHLRSPTVNYGVMNYGVMNCGMLNLAFLCTLVVIAIDRDRIFH